MDRLPPSCCPAPTAGERRSSIRAHTRGAPARTGLRPVGRGLLHVLPSAAPHRAIGRAAYRPKRPSTWGSCTGRASPSGSGYTPSLPLLRTRRTGRAALRPKRPHAWGSCSDRASPGGESAERPPIRVGRALDSARRSISLGQGGAGAGRPFRILSQTPPHQPCCRGDAPKEGLHLSTNHRRRSAQRWW